MDIIWYQSPQLELCLSFNFPYDNCFLINIIVVFIKRQSQIVTTLLFNKSHSYSEFSNKVNKASAPYPCMRLMRSVVPLSIMAKDANIPLYTISQLSALYAVLFLSVDSRFLPDSILIAKIDKNQN